MLAFLRGATVHGKGVFGMIDGSPVFEFGLEGGFDFPILDKVFDELGEGIGFMVHALGYRENGQLHDKVSHVSMT